MIDIKRTFWWICFKFIINFQYYNIILHKFGGKVTTKSQLIQIMN